jgi:hypothetical protein
MRVFRRLQAWLFGRQNEKAKVDDGQMHVLDRAVLQRIHEAEDILLSAIGVLGAPTRRRYVDLLLSIALTVASLSGAWFLYGVAVPKTPLAAPAGAIGVAVSGSDRPVDVQATFSVARTDHTKFRLTVPIGDPTAVPGREFFLYFCGPASEGLRLTDLNTGPLEVRDDRKSVVIQDSWLGNRSQCVTAVSKPSPIGQSIIEGSYANPIVHQSAYRILYALPAVTTLGAREDTNGRQVVPLAPGSTISVSVGDAPTDLSVAAATPLVPDSGQLSWKWESAPLSTQPPRTYRIDGVLMDVEARAQAVLLAAGMLLGVAGSGFIWLIQLLTERSKNRKGVTRQVKDEGGL